MEMNTEDNSKKKPEKSKVILGFIIIISMCICIAAFGFWGISSSDNSKKAKELNINSLEIPFTVVKENQINNGGFSRILVIDPKFRNEGDLRKLGDELVAISKNDRNAFVDVFDDANAAAMQQNLSSLSDEDLKFYDKHYIAIYKHNSNTNYHQYSIMLNGPEGETISVKY